MNEDHFILFNGNTTLTLSTDDLQPGLYLITIKPEEGQEKRSYKFLKK
jgi:hypothetical protein